MSVRFHLLIPARMASTRLPGKPLALLDGKPMVVRVLERALAAGAVSVHVATDSEAIAAAVEEAGGRFIMTRADHLTGTDRLAEAAAGLDLDDEDIVVNLQGDEPLMPARCLQQVAALLHADPDARLATLWLPILKKREWEDPNVVKVVSDRHGRALYFSRAPIPHPRAGGFQAGRASRHIGLYAYRAAALRQWPGLPAAELEALESLEQLRALAAGWRIIGAEACAPIPPGIDTPQDLARLQGRFVNANPMDE